MQFIKNLVRDEAGATAIEYGLIAAGISIAISGIVFTAGERLVALMNAIIEALNSVLG